MSRISINEIAKLTIAELAKAGMLLTPQNYEQMYESVAAKMGVSSGRNERINGYLNRLSPSIKEVATKAAPASEAELISFLIARLNQNPKSSAADNSALVLIRSLLKLLVRTPYANIRELANSSQESLKQGAVAISAVKNTWIAELSALCEELDEINAASSQLGLSGDAKTDISKLSQLMAAARGNGATCAMPDDEFCTKLAPVLAYSLTPSIASDVNTEIGRVKSDLCSKVKLICEPSFAQLASELIKQRIELDRAEISSSHRVLDDLLIQVGAKIETILKMATSGEEKISQIRKEIAEIKSDSPVIEQLKERLLKIVVSLEAEVGILKEHTSHDLINISELQTKVNGLQQEITKLKEESQQDFLTQLSNKRHIETCLSNAEDGFGLYNINYSIAFFDIDHFKKINDTYGHTAGDAILAGIGHIIAQNARKLDCAGRYGGEEFMLIMPHTDLHQARRIADAIREQVASHKFVYKDKLIQVRLSGGVAQRIEVESKESLVEQADKLLYEAKAAGRDQIKS